MIKKKNIYKTFLIFIFFHLFLWTLIPSISNLNLPLDTIEALAWGSNLDWGYSKHPPVSAFAVEFFFKIFGVNWYAYIIHSSIFNCLIYIYNVKHTITGVYMKIFYNHQLKIILPST